MHFCCGSAEGQRPVHKPAQGNALENLALGPCCTKIPHMNPSRLFALSLCLLGRKENALENCQLAVERDPRFGEDKTLTGRTGDLFSSAIRVGDLKLVEFPVEKRTEPYDLASNPGEAKHLAEERPADRDRLLAKLNA